MDLETSGHTTYRRFCNPLDSNHEITVVAFKEQGQEAKIVSDYQHGIDRNNVFDSIDLDNINIICGQNFKFDMLWFWMNPKFQQWLKDGGMIWDTQTVEYLLTGQRFGKRSLDALALKYGAEVKDDRIGAMYKAGMTSKEIAPSMLEPYAIADVENTNKVLQGQFKLAKKLGMLPIIKIYMEHYLAVTEMEYQGMHIDIDLAKKRTKELELEREELCNKISAIARDYWPAHIDFNSGSLEHVSALLFSGTILNVEPVPSLDADGNMQYYKSGQKEGMLKTRNEKVAHEIKGFQLKPKSIWQKKKGHYGSDEKILTELLGKYSHEDIQYFISLLLDYRRINKLITTYYYSAEYYKTTGKLKKETGLIPLIHPDGCLHTEFKTAYTRTGRLASQNPNAQNLSPEILDMFNSRWGDKGSIVEIDYSQLEVRVQAWITQSKQMIQDIKDGVDFHTLRLSYAEDMSYEETLQNVQQLLEWKDKRKKAKVISFQKAYGAQSEKISQSTGLSVGVVEKVFQKEDRRYPEVNQYYDLAQADIRNSRRPTDKLVKIRNKAEGTYTELPGEFEAYGVYQSITGKLYSFEEKAVLTKHGKVFRYLSVPDIQNYPIQGTAADIVASQVGEVFKFLSHCRDKAVMVNEVHDSLILDVKNEYLDLIVEKVCAILERVEEDFEKKLGVKVNVPIKVDVAIGKTWAEAKANG